MLVELVRTTTKDGLRLDGALSVPVDNETLGVAVDAFVFLHGVGGSFYGGALFQKLQSAFLKLGSAVVRVNTRGHGSVSMIATTGGASRYGAAFEVVDQCRYDVRAWVDCLVERGYQRIGVVGHSLGAIKAVYAIALESHPSVVCVLAASPPRLSYAAFQNSPRSADHFSSIDAARAYVADGKPDQLFTASFPFPMLICAATYLDKYGPDERYHFLPLVSKLSVPTLFTYGQLELESGGVAFAGLPDAIQTAAANVPSIQVTTIPGADHFYTGKYGELATAMADWVRTELPPR
jgi:pimeloyl-ACP methyl ester carboxylesterase